MKNAPMILGFLALFGLVAAIALVSIGTDRAPEATPMATEEALGAPPGPTYFAEIDSDGTVLRVIVADQAFIDSGAVGDAKNWVQVYRDGRTGINVGPDHTYNKTQGIFEDKRVAPERIIAPSASASFK